MKIIKTIVVTASLLLGMFGLTAATVNAQNSAKIIEGVNNTGACTGTAAEQAACRSGSGVGDTIQNIINLISLIVGIIAVIMIIIAGLMFITAGGDSSKVANARNTIIYAAIGLVIVALAQTIVRFVLNRTTS